MSETTGTPALNKALAELQADLPQIIKDAQADVPGKEGKRGYSYKYADLATVSAEVLPKLGARGLAFTSRPTLVDGQFGLLYELLHESGEAMSGFYPLPGQGTPQTIGSAITYARRYCLCAVTGTAPAEDDDDAQAANGQSVQMSRQSAGDAWDSASPSRPSQPAPRNGNGQGRVSRPTQPATPPAQTTNSDPDPDAQGYADEAAEARTVDALRVIHTKAHDANHLQSPVRSPSGGTGPLGVYLEWRRKQLTDEAKALKELTDAAGDMPAEKVAEHVQKVTGTEIEGASAAQLREAAKVLRSGAAA